MSRRISLLNNKKYTYEYFCQDGVCRLCWSKSKGKVAKSIKTEPTVSEKILEFIGIDVTTGVPTTVCSICLSKIDSFIEFKNYCNITDAKLRTILLSNLNQDSEVKEEEQLVIPKKDAEDLAMITETPEPERSLQRNKIKQEKTSGSDGRDTGQDNVPLQHQKTYDSYDQDNDPLQDEKATYDSDDQAIGQDNVVVQDKKYCDICDQTFDSLNKKNHHVKVVHRAKKKVYECSGCKKKFADYACKLSHEAFYCNRNKYKCTQCGMFFQQRRVLETHLKKKHLIKEKALKVKIKRDSKDETPKRYQCDICTESFDFYKKLMNHMTSHKDSNEFICDSCGKVFHTKYTLQAHSLIHTNPKQLKCPHCEYRATQSSSLIVHLRIHTGARPFACEKCPSTFTTSSNLSQHRRLHLGIKNYKCQICNKEYMYKKSLTEHITSAHEKTKNNMCKRCGALYFRFEHLRKHIFVKHKKIVKKVKDDYFEVKDAVHKKMGKSKEATDTSEDK